MKTENGNSMIGYMDLDGLAVPRAKLAQVLPDINRFERCLPDALTLSQYMTDNSGDMPAYVTRWPNSYLNDVAATLKELAGIEKQAAKTLHMEAATR